MRADINLLPKDFQQRPSLRLCNCADWDQRSFLLFSHWRISFSAHEETLEVRITVRLFTYLQQIVGSVEWRVNSNEKFSFVKKLNESFLNLSRIFSFLSFNFLWWKIISSQESGNISLRSSLLGSILTFIKSHLIQWTQSWKCHNKLLLIFWHQTSNLVKHQFIHRSRLTIKYLDTFLKSWLIETNRVKCCNWNLIDDVSST